MSLIPVLEPLIDDFQEFMDTLDKKALADALSKAFISMGKALKFLHEYTYPILITLGGLFLGKMAMGFALFLKQMGLLGVVAPQVGGSLALANISFLEFAAAVVLVGAGIALAAYGLSFLVESFGEIGDNAGYAVAGIIAFGVTMAGIITTFAYMAPVVLPATAALIKFGTAIAITGAGVGLAAAGIGYMAASFAGLMKVASADQLWALGGALALISVSAAGLGYIAPIAGAGMGILVLGFVGLAIALGMMSEELVSLEKFTTSLGALVKDSTGLKEVATEIVNIANAISSLPEGRAIELSTAMRSSQISATSAAMMHSVREASPAAATNQRDPVFEVKVLVDGVVTKAVHTVDKKIQGEYLDTGGGLIGAGAVRP